LGLAATSVAATSFSSPLGFEIKQNLEKAHDEKDVVVLTVRWFLLVA